MFMAACLHRWKFRCSLYNTRKCSIKLISVNIILYFKLGNQMGLPEYSSGKKLIGPTRYPLSNTRDETQRDATLANPSNFRTSKTHVLVLGNAQPPGPVMTKHSVLVWCKLSLRKSHHTHTLLQYWMEVWCFIRLLFPIFRYFKSSPLMLSTRMYSGVLE